MKPKIWVFDVDGTLVDSLSVSYKIDSEIIREFGGNVPDIESYRGVLGEGSWNDFYRKFGVDIETERALELYYSRISQSGHKPIPGARDLLKRLSEGGTERAVVSINESRDHILNKLSSAGLEEYFMSEDVYCEKDSKEKVLKEVCSKRGATPQEVLYVGDTAKDVREARTAGLRTAAISNKFSYNPHNLIRQANPDYLVADITDLSKLLEEK